MHFNDNPPGFKEPEGQTNQAGMQKPQNLDRYLFSVIETAQEGIWILDANGSTIYANPRMISLLGSTTEEMRSKRRSDFLFDIEQDTDHLLREQSLEEPSRSFECRYRQSNGGERWTYITADAAHGQDGNYIGTVAMHSDITEWKSVKSTLQKSGEILRAVFDSVKDCAIMTLDKDRRVISWNVGGKEIFGYAENEIIGQLSDILFTNEDISNSVPEKEAADALKKGRSNGDRWHKRKDGSLVFVGGVLTLLEDGCEPARFIKITRDWTRQKKLEDLLTSAERHKHEFLATLAHELRNPLASVFSGIEVLKEERDDTRRNHTIEAIDRQARQMIHLVNDLLDIARIDEGKLKMTKIPINLTDAINDSLEVLRPIMKGYRHSLNVSLPPGPIVVNGDKTRLSQVFLNILINAAKYTPPGGNITLDATIKNDVAVIRVRDNGMGIPTHLLSKIFEMFEQIQHRSEYPQAGLGIGLSVVRTIVEMHEGRVEAYSEGKNKGCEFVVHIPLQQAGAYAIPQNEIQETTSKREMPARNKRVLLIDDNSDATDMMEILLKRKGYTIRKAYDGRSGISIALEFDPEVVLLDIGLPDIDGYEVIRELKAKLTKTKFIAVSGWGQEDDKLKSKKAGFDHHLVKPIDIHAIDQLINFET